MLAKRTSNPATTGRMTLPPKINCTDESKRYCRTGTSDESRGRLFVKKRDPSLGEGGAGEGIRGWGAKRGEWGKNTTRGEPAPRAFTTQGPRGMGIGSGKL